MAVFALQQFDAILQILYYVIYAGLLINYRLSNAEVITVSNGDIVGTEISHDGRVIEVYKGIPYAKPPLGQLRFMKPEPSSKWEGVLNATGYGPICTQFVTFPTGDSENPETSEDCLTLNVFAPTDSSESPLAIMVWIHGGGLVGGQAQAYDPREIVAKGDVIVVTINYRLGPLGFLSTEDENAPGNFGLWDQLLAIEWVRDNAAAFGGDPERITVFGESAGGWSVSALLLSPKSKGVFQRGISQSGVMNDDMLKVNPLKDTRALAEPLNCNEDDTTLLVECLRGVSVEDLVIYNDPFAWFIVIDGEFLPDLTSKLSDNIGGFDYMLGFNEREGFVLSLSNLGVLDVSSPTNEGISKDTFTNSINYTITNHVPSLTENNCQLRKVIDAATFAYTHWEDIENAPERLLNLVKFWGDINIEAPSVSLARRHQSARGNGATFLYYFTFKSSNPLSSSISALFSPPWNDKATHSDELYLILIPAFVPTFNEAEKNVSKALITYWTNFAKTGDPNEPIQEGIPVWSKFGATGEYTDIGEVTLTGKNTNDIDPKYINFWLEYIPRLIDDDSCFCEELEGNEVEKGFFTTGSFSKVATCVFLAIILIFRNWA